MGALRRLTLAHPHRETRVSRMWRAGVRAAFVATIAAGCAEPADQTAVIAAGGDADALIPLLWNQTQGRIDTELMFDKLADLGPGQSSLGDASYTPRLASTWTWAKDSLSITFHLDPRARWHDGVPVTARDVKFAYAVYTDTSVHANAGEDFRRALDSVTAPDSLTAVVWYRARSPEQFHSVAYNLVPLPEHLLTNIRRDSLRTSAFARHPVGNGPFRFIAWTPGDRLELAANTEYAWGRPPLDRVIVMTLRPDAASRAVLAGDADFYERFTLDDVAEAAKSKDVDVVHVGQYAYSLVNFNQVGPDGRSPHQVLGTAAMRRALTMAVNRPAIVRNVLDSLARPALGPFTRAQWTADTTLRQLAYDTAAAAKTLDSLGWRRGPDGTRARNGKPLGFTLTVMSSSRPLMRTAELLQQAWTAAGVKVTLDPLDPRALAERLGGWQFDAATLTWNASPSPSGLRQTWGSASHRKGSPYNAGGWANAAFDAQVDSGLADRSLAGAKAHFAKAYQFAVDEAPALWLYEPALVLGKSRRLVTGPIQPDAWWQSVRNWKVTGPRRGGAPAR